MTRYLSGLCVAGLGLCGGGWLVVAAVAFGGESAGRAGRVNLLTGAVLIAVCCLSLVCWSSAWRQRLRADGVLADRFPLVSRREARRNRRALSRDVRRAAKLAERSARGARRAARRSARLASGGALSEGGVLGEGVALGVASAGDEQYGAAASDGAGVNGSATNGAGVNGASVHGADGARLERGGPERGGPEPGGPERGLRQAGRRERGRCERFGGARNGPGRFRGKRSGREPGGARGPIDQRTALDAGAAAGRHRWPARARGAAGSRAPSPVSLLRPRKRPAAPPSPLPQRSRFASELRPRADGRRHMAMPRVRPAPMSIPRLASAADDSAPGPASDGEDAWW